MERYAPVAKDLAGVQGNDHEDQRRTVRRRVVVRGR